MLTQENRFHIALILLQIWHFKVKCCHHTLLNCIYNQFASKTAMLSIGLTAVEEHVTTQTSALPLTGVLSLRQVGRRQRRLNCF